MCWYISNFINYLISYIQNFWRILHWFSCNYKHIHLLQWRIKITILDPGVDEVFRLRREFTRTSTLFWKIAFASLRNRSLSYSDQRGGDSLSLVRQTKDSSRFTTALARPRLELIRARDISEMSADRKRDGETEAEREGKEEEQGVRGRKVHAARMDSIGKRRLLVYRRAIRYLWYSCVPLIGNLTKCNRRSFRTLRYFADLGHYIFINYIYIFLLFWNCMLITVPATKLFWFNKNIG